MTTEDSTLREVDQELAEERQYETIRRFAPLLIGGAVAVILSVAGWQFYTQNKVAQSEKGALAYQKALFSLEENQALGRQDLNLIASSDAAGYAALALFREASLFAQEGDGVQAYNTYKKIIELDGVTRHIQNLARLRAAYLSLDSAGREAVLSDLGDLPREASPMGYYAQELVALADLTGKDYDAAIRGFDALSASLETPPALRQRAQEFAVLSRSAKAGANITGEARVEDLLDSLGESSTDTLIPEVTVPNAGAIEALDGEIGHNHDDHEGHAHEEGDNLVITGDTLEEAIPAPEVEENQTQDNTPGR